MVTIVIDFTGLVVEGYFVIKEFCKAHISPTSIKVESPLLIDTSKLKFSTDFYSNPAFRNFYDQCRIPWSQKSDLISSDLWVKLKALLGLKCDIYVRNRQHAETLSQYLGISYVPFKALTDLDAKFDTVIMRTTCRNHQSRESYCVRENVRMMALWLKKNLGNPSGARDKHAVVHFNGFYGLDGQFIIKELCVYCLDNEGAIFHNQLLVAILLDRQDTSNANKIHYQKNFYDKFGIPRVVGNCKTFFLKWKILNILLVKKVAVVYVKNNARRDILRPLVGSGFKIICLDEFNFVKGPMVGQCEFHSHVQKDKNVCAKPVVQSMIHWILEKRLLEKEVRDQFGPSS